LKIIFIFLPSTRDIHHYPVFPQAPLNGLNIDKNWYFFPNPSHFFINYLKFAICNQDILIELSRREFSFNMENRIKRLVTHILEQKCFYPIYPSTENTIDWGNLKNFKLEFIPDILIIPSRLKKKIILLKDQCIYINPGYLAQNNTGGTFSIIKSYKYSNDTKNRKIIVEIRNF